MIPVDPNAIVTSVFGAKADRLFAAVLSQKPQKADAIVFIQGDQLDRAAKVKELYNNSFAKHIVITGNNKLIGPGRRTEENDVHLLVLRDYLVKQEVPESMIIIDDRSFQTVDQAVNTIRLAKKKRWLRLLLVTSPYHALRTFLTFVKQIQEQNWKGSISVQVADLPWDVSPSGRVRTSIEMLKVEMEKIKEYAHDMATIEEGTRFLQSHADKNA